LLASDVDVVVNITEGTTVLQYLMAPFVRTCRTTYLNPDLPKKEGFVLKRGEVYGIISRKGWTVGFVVETSARSERQEEAAVEYLNANLEEIFY